MFDNLVVWISSGLAVRAMESARAQVPLSLVNHRSVNQVLR
jgi:hypothetical protein